MEAVISTSPDTPSTIRNSSRIGPIGWTPSSTEKAVDHARCAGAGFEGGLDDGGFRRYRRRTLKGRRGLTAKLPPSGGSISFAKTEDWRNQVSKAS